MSRPQRRPRLGRRPAAAGAASSGRRPAAAGTAGQGRRTRDVVILILCTKGNGMNESATTPSTSAQQQLTNTSHITHNTLDIHITLSRIMHSAFHTSQPSLCARCSSWLATATRFGPPPRRRPGVEQTEGKRPSPPSPLLPRERDREMRSIF